MTLNPYAYALADRDPIEVIAETPNRLANILALLAPEALNTQPYPGKWSPREVVAHLADCEISFSFRLRQTLAGEQNIQPFDQDLWARNYSTYTAEQALATFTALRNWNVSFLTTLTEADKQKPATHPERGTMTLWTIVETMAGHDTHHLNALEKS